MIGSCKYIDVSLRERSQVASLPPTLRASPGETLLTIKNIRAALVADPELGAGNVLPKLLEHGADLDGPGLTFDVPVDDHPAWRELTLGGLQERVLARAAWLHRRGIKTHDPVAICVTSPADLLLNFMALSWLG